jgi:hypothetical protein
MPLLSSIARASGWLAMPDAFERLGWRSLTTSRDGHVSDI